MVAAPCHCASCGYDLREQKAGDRCPECGERFSGEVATPPRRPRRWRRTGRGLAIAAASLAFAVLAASSWSSLAPRAPERSRAAAARRQVDHIARQVGLWLLERGLSEIPEDFRLRQLTEGEDRYLEADELLDPWGNLVVFVHPNRRHPYLCVISWGADGVLGGVADAADVVNGKT